MILNAVMTRSACALAVICIGGLAAGVSPALAAFPGENGKIAFDSDRDGGDFDIWTMSPDGGNTVNLTANSDGFDALPNWRADGRKIAFMSDRETPRNPTPPGLPGPDLEIFVMNADGSHQTQVTFNSVDDENPAWSPNGKQLVFQRDFDPIRGQADCDILTIEVNGTRERNLTRSPGVQDFEPNWSPTGRRIAFGSERDGDGEIYTMRPDGSRVRQLTLNASHDGAPDWSPDGRLIAFFAERDGNVDVYTMRQDGGEQTRLTDHAAGDGDPAWSPDGRQLAFASFRDANVEVYTMRADGSHQVNRTSNGAFDIAPAWQPLDDDADDHDDGDE